MDKATAQVKDNSLSAPQTRWEARMREAAWTRRTLAIRGVLGAYSVALRLVEEARILLDEALRLLDVAAALARSLADLTPETEGVVRPTLVRVLRGEWERTRERVEKRVRDLPQYHEDSDEVDAHLHGCEEALVTLVATALGCSWCDHVRRVGKRLPASYAVDRPALAAEVLRTLRDEREVQR